LDQTPYLSVPKPFEIKIVSGFGDNFCWDSLAGSSGHYHSSSSSSEAWLLPQHHLCSAPAETACGLGSACFFCGIGVHGCGVPLLGQREGAHRKAGVLWPGPMYWSQYHTVML